MVHFVGAGSGAPDLITLRGKKFLEEADVVIYAGSLVNPQLLEYTKENCEIYNSAKMTLEEVLDVIFAAEEKGLTTVRLHTGDPSLYGAIREQMDVLEEKNIAFDYCPGVSSILWRCIRTESGIHASGCITECDHHPYGRKNAGTGEREHPVLCCTPCNDGSIFEYRHAGRTEQNG